MIPTQLKCPHTLTGLLTMTNANDASFVSPRYWTVQKKELCGRHLTIQAAEHAWPLAFQFRIRLQRQCTGHGFTVSGLDGWPAPHLYAHQRTRSKQRTHARVAHRHTRLLAHSYLTMDHQARYDTFDSTRLVFNWRRKALNDASSIA